MRFAPCLVCCVLVPTVQQAFAQSKLDIEKVADSVADSYAYGEGPGEERKLVENEQRMFNRLIFHVADTELKARNELEVQLASAIRGIAKSSKLNKAQLEKLKLAGKVDIARLLAEMRMVREKFKPNNRQELIRLVQERRPAQKRIRSMFTWPPKSPTPVVNPLLRFEQPKSLFQRTANTILDEPEIDPLHDHAQRRQQKQVIAEMKQTLVTLEEEWRQKAKLKRPKLKQQGKLK